MGLNPFPSDLSGLIGTGSAPADLYARLRKIVCEQPEGLITMAAVAASFGWGHDQYYSILLIK